MPRKAKKDKEGQNRTKQARTSTDKAGHAQISPDTPSQVKTGPNKPIQAVTHPRQTDITPRQISQENPKSKEETRFLEPEIIFGKFLAICLIFNVYKNKMYHKNNV